MHVIGVDGCPGGGWVAVCYDIGLDTLIARTHNSFQQLLDAYPDAVAIAVDIPIGLSMGTPRECDLAARRVLQDRRSSVFPAPDPRVVHSLTYEEAKAESHTLTGKGISKQAFVIYSKVAEVNRLVGPGTQDRVFEIHPEVSFWALAGRPMRYAKRTTEGYEERRKLLLSEFAHPIWSRAEARGAARPAKPDDLLDATVAAWTARRAAEYRAGRLPSEPAMDARGLRMEIVF